jgi:hypothetical protein
MVRFGRTISSWVRLVVAVVTALCMLEGVVSAEVAGAPPVTQVPQRSVVSREQAQAVRRPIREAVATLDYGRIAAKAAKSPALQVSSSRKSSVGRKILGAAIGATAGFFAGGYLGAAIDGDCGGCDDPGLKGALIGAPVGAVTGGILGAVVF